LKRILCISDNPNDIRKLSRDYEFELLQWPEQGKYGDNIHEIIENKCSKVEDIEKIDIVICENVSSTPILFQIRKNGYNGPVILVPHINPYPIINMLHITLASQCWGPNDIVIAGSRDAAKRYERFFGMRSYPIPTYGIDTALFSKKNKSFSRNKLNLPDGQLLLYTGRCDADKNIGALLAVYESLHKTYPTIKLVMSNLFKDSFYMNSFSKQLEEVIFFEKLDLKVMPYLYSASDLFVSCGTSYFETFGRSPLESIACGTPVVVPNWNGFRDYVGMESGKLVSVDFLDTALYEPFSYSMVDLSEFAERCIEMLSSSNKPKLQKNATYEYTLDKFSEILLRLSREKSSISPLKYELKIMKPVIGYILNNLDINSIEKLFEMNTCSADKLPFINPDIIRELYFAFYK
jgi:glycosyltransferase involved in cell wall biosynthesis